MEVHLNAWCERNSLNHLHEWVTIYDKYGCVPLKILANAIQIYMKHVWVIK